MYMYNYLHMKTSYGDIWCMRQETKVNKNDPLLSLLRTRLNFHRFKLNCLLENKDTKQIYILFFGF